MFARVSTVTVPRDRAEDAARGFGSVLDTLRGIDGVREAFLLVDRSSGKGMTITLWEDENALRASEEAANALREQAARSAGGTIEQVDRYEVVLHETFGRDAGVG